ncbi:unnamed protein product [Ceratitis capitata]|uniref:(Mediterranean fruit fly) hypothetical protein n=1 Tax=Ceratitis capitata TaxID=7213 RepID=A0A811UA76_CERCA|nr:unnamed protein product [Ceratitis capitata]
MNESIIKGICKVIGTTLTKYKDSASQLLVRNLIVDIIKQHHDVAIIHMTTVIKTILSKELSKLPPQKCAKFSLIALGWTDLIIRNGTSNSNVYKTEYPKLVEYQSILYQHILLSCNIRIVEMAEKIFFDSWLNSYIFDMCFSTMLTKEPAHSVIILIMLLIRFERRHSDNKEYDIKYKSKLLEYFVKGVITSKIKPHNSVINACRPLLIDLSQEDFKENLFPVLLKSILRSPEVAIYTMGNIIHHINIDLSEYTSSFGKVILQNLYCKDDVTRKESLETLKELSQKCTTIESVEYLLRGIFDILNGVNGKVTVTEYRINLIQVCINENNSLLSLYVFM